MYLALRIKGAARPPNNIAMKASATVYEGKISDRSVVTTVTSAATVIPGASASASWMLSHVSTTK
jgi:hypothetical protein